MSTVNINVVKAQADTLGISYHHRAGAEKIAGLIAAHLAEHPEDALRLVPANAVEAEAVTPETETSTNPLRANGDPCPVKPLKQAEYRKGEMRDRMREVNHLRRVIITCMNPNKREWPGENISVGSAKLGTFKKFIPFDGNPYHVPQIIYDVLKERKYTAYKSVPFGRPGANGARQTKREGYLAPEFQVTDLPPLTDKELSDLAHQQALAKAGL